MTKRIQPFAGPHAHPQVTCPRGAMAVADCAVVRG